MNLRSVSRKLAQGEIQYALGRFHLVRRLYSLGRRLRDPATSRGHSQLWPGFDTRRAALHLSNDSHATGFDLPPNVVDEIRDFAHRTEWFRPGHPGHFKLDEVMDGRVHGQPVAVAYSDGAEECQAVQRIIDDRALRETAGRHLGYEPRLGVARLYWSPVTDLSVLERRSLNQTVEFHYDVDALGFCYAHFYLNDVDQGGGPHVLIPGTHKKKPISLLWGSARMSEDRVHRHWGHADVVLTGPAGTGFLEDTSCLHRAMAPDRTERLMLQLRFN